MDNLLVILLNSALIKVTMGLAAAYFLGRIMLNYLDDLKTPFRQKLGLGFFLIIFSVLILQPTTVTPTNTLDVNIHSVDDRVSRNIEKAGPPVINGPADSRDVDEETNKYRNQFRDRQNEIVNSEK